MRGLFDLFHGLPQVEQQRLSELSGEVFPTGRAPAVRAAGEEAALFVPRWGFAGQDRRQPVVNARAETVAERPMFRESFALRRCLVPASRFFEWDKLTSQGRGPKTKYVFTRADGAPLLLAGCWKRGPEGERFVVLTTAANSSMAEIHDRMPVLIAPENARDYLFDEASARLLATQQGPELLREAQLPPGGGEQLRF